ncbi:MAG: cation transporter, partial [Planctomycetes bacterium]|nr:cation transporter [Planctomycetota bacterium]
MEDQSCIHCQVCADRLMIWALLISLGLSLTEGLIGVLGKSEALVAAGLYTFYQSFICGRSFFQAKWPNAAGKKGFINSQLWFANLVVGLILLAGLADILLFSIIHLIKASRGMLVEPSLYAFCAASLAMLANYSMLRYSNCIIRQPDGKTVLELNLSLRFSVTISALVIIGVLLSSWVWLGGDALAALILVCLLVKPMVNLFRDVLIGLKIKQPM